MLQNFVFDGLWHHLIKFVFPCLFDELLFAVAGAGDDHRLNLLMFIIQVSDFAGCLIPILFLHGQVHENQTVDRVPCKRLLHFLHTVVAVVCRVDEAIQPGELDHGFDSHPESLDVEHLVVDDQDAASVRPIRKSYVLKLENIV